MFRFFFVCFMVVIWRGAKLVVFPVVPYLPPVLPTKLVSVEETPTGAVSCCVMGYCSGMSIYLGIL